MKWHVPRAAADPETNIVPSLAPAPSPAPSMGAHARTSAIPRSRSAQARAIDRTRAIKTTSRT